MKDDDDQFVRRADEKAASRAADDAAVASGEKSRASLIGENSFFPVFRDRIVVDFSKARRKY